MATKLNIHHLTVTGFTSDKKGSPLSKPKTALTKLKDAKDCITSMSDDFGDVLEIAFQIFKRKSTKNISDTERKIAGLKVKIETANTELGTIYQNQLDELEHTKRTLISNIEEYKSEGKDKWKSFEREFNRNSEEFEKELEGFVDNLREK